MNIKDFIKPNVLQLKPYNSARSEYSGNSGIFLDANENPYGKFNRYPDPTKKLLKIKFLP
jgi:histidinol-phosphate aminotransferase